MAAEDKSYRLIFADGGAGYEIVAFNAPGIASALWLAQSYCGDGPGELFENGRRLGSVNAAIAGSIPLHFK